MQPLAVCACKTGLSLWKMITITQLQFTSCRFGNQSISAWNKSTWPFWRPATCSAVPTLSAWMIRLWKTIKYYKSWLQVSLQSTIQRVYTLGNISACQVSIASLLLFTLADIRSFPVTAFAACTFTSTT